jgi:hypothetical protein
MLSAQILDTYDRCERRFAFSQAYEPKIISPLAVLYAAVEAALVDDDPEQAAKDETMRIASTHDIILTEINAFVTTRHLGYLAAIIAVALRGRFGAFRAVPETAGWHSGLFEAESGKRHRIELVSHFDDDRLRAAAHSWRVVGELAALQKPLTLTAVVIGPQRGGRRHSEWAKGLLHPANKQLRFAPRNNKKTGFNDGWNKVWREQETISTERWLQQMSDDGVIDQLIVSRDIAYRADDNRMLAARREMDDISKLMQSASSLSPMRRSSCDEWGGCCWQSACYSPVPATPASFPHLYQVRASEDRG